MREIAPVVSGLGRVEDHTHKGWGVVIDTIEIQDVRVLSGQVFGNMQARFRQEQMRIAREAELAREQSIKQDEAAAERKIELTRVAASTEIRRQKQQADEFAKLEQIQTESRVAEAKLTHERSTRQGELANERDLSLAKL